MILEYSRYVVSGLFTKNSANYGVFHNLQASCCLRFLDICYIMQSETKVFLLVRETKVVIKPFEVSNIKSKFMTSQLVSGPSKLAVISYKRYSIQLGCTKEENKSKRAVFDWVSGNQNQSNYSCSQSQQT